MKKYELNKEDFQAIDVALQLAIAECDKSKVPCSRLEKLKDQFAKAHTGWLEIEEN